MVVESSATAVFFDSFVVVGSGESSDTTAFATSRTSGDRYISVSLRFAPPPAISYVHLHTEEELCGTPTIVAADGDLLLIHATVVVDGQPGSSYPANYFVYRARPLSPSLRRLPDLPSSWNGQVREFNIARCGDAEYVVMAFHATITKDPGSDGIKEVGNLLRYSSNDKDEWEFMVLPIPHDPQNGLHEFLWETDKAFSFGRYMCWVDYHRGGLFCDMHASDPKLRFICFPGIEIWDDSHDLSNGRQGPRSYRTVDVSKGLVKFVDVDNGIGGRTKSSGFTITTWTLRIPDFEWEKDDVLQVDDLWSLPDYQQSPLPRWPPEFPVVCKLDPHVLHFILQGSKFRAKSWMITIDVKEMALRSYMIYVTPIRKLLSMWSDLPCKEEDDDDDATSFSGSLIICPQFHATTT